jgi:carbamoyltransferase
MIVLGVSGFEDAVRLTAPRAGGAERKPQSSLSFRDGRVPLQFFPLGLIGHDSAAAIVVDGRLVATAAEERFTRQKHGINLAGRTVLPRRAIRYCLEAAGCRWRDVDLVAHYCRFTPAAVEARAERVGRGVPPELRDELLREYRGAFARRLDPELVRAQLEQVAGEPLDPGRFVSVPHHVAHAAGAFFGSGWDEALCLTLDGYGEEESALWAEGSADGIVPRGRTLLPNSLGTLYQVVTQFLGFGAFGDEYKTMGLAAYGDPARFASVFAELVRLESGGSWSTAIARADLYQWLIARLGPCESPGALTPRNADVAAALQDALERAVLHQLRWLRRQFPQARLCLSGGVALNARMNGAVVRSRLFERVYVQPAAADDGAALGAALWASADRGGRRWKAGVSHCFWGPGYSDECIEQALAAADGLAWERVPDIEIRTARLLAEGRIVGWYQGRMEAGPRALGGRSILTAPSSVELSERLNLLVKRREPFRPFAPSVRAEAASAYFEIPDSTAAGFMIVTYPVRREVRGRIAGVVHVDGSARVQVVRHQDHPRYHRLLAEFGGLTGIPVLLNTSFNQSGEPIVCTPADAVQCFLRAGLDALAIGDYLALRPVAAGGNPA